MPFYTVIPQVEKEHESAFSLEHHAVPSPAPASRPEQPQSVSFGRYLETSLEDGWQSGALMTLRHEARLNDARFGGEQISDLVELAEKGGLTGLDDLPALEVQGELSLEEQRERIRGAGLEGVLEPQAGYNRAALELDIERSRAIQERAGILAGAPAWMAPFGTAVRMGASMADPIELAVSFIPVIGQQRYLRMLGQMGGAWGRAAVRAGVGAVEGAVGAALLEPLIFADRSRTVPGYGALDAVENIIFGAGTGALAHAGLGALGEGKRFLFDQRHPWEVKPPTEESEALRRDFEERLFSAGQEAGAEITREQARAASVLFDARARTWAWDNGKETAEFYRLYAPDMQSGKTAGKMDTGEDPGLSAGEPLVRAGIRRKPDSAAARVVSIPADAVPEFARMKDFASWVKDMLAESGDVIIKATGQEARFSSKNTKASVKRSRSREHRTAYSGLREMVENAEYDHYEPADERHPGKGGQDVYYSALAMGGKLYSVKIKLDVLTEKEKAARQTQEDVRYKDHKLTEIEIASVKDRSVAKNGKPAHVTDAISEVSLGVLRGTVKPSRIEDNVLFQPPVNNRSAGADVQTGKSTGEIDTGESPGLPAGEPLVRAGIRRKPDSAAARVVSIPADAVPEFANMKDFALWVKALLAEGGDITIDSTRQTMRFTKTNIGASLKRSRSREHRNAYAGLREMVKNAEYDHYEAPDARHPDRGGQDVYYSALRMGDKLYSVRLKMDVVTEEERMAEYGRKGNKIEDARYKDHKLVEIEIAPALYRGVTENGKATQPADAISGISLGVLRGAVKPSRIEDNVLFQPPVNNRSAGTDVQTGKSTGEIDTGEGPGLPAGEPLVRAGIRRKPDSAAARVVSIPADAVPEFANMKDFALWVKALLAEGGDITIDSTQQTMRFTKTNIGASLKRSRSREHRNAYAGLREMVKNAEYDHYEAPDARHPDRGGQDVYYSALRMGDKLYSVRLKMDVPTTNEKSLRLEHGEAQLEDTRYKDHKLAEIEIAPALESGLSPEGEATQQADAIFRGQLRCSARCCQALSHRGQRALSAAGEQPFRRGGHAEREEYGEGRARFP